MEKVVTIVYPSGKSRVSKKAKKRWEVEWHTHPVREKLLNSTLHHD